MVGALAGCRYNSADVTCMLAALDMKCQEMQSNSNDDGRRVR